MPSIFGGLFCVLISLIDYLQSMKKLPIICALGLIGLSWQASGQQTGDGPITLAKQPGSSVSHDTVKIKSCIVKDGFSLPHKNPNIITTDSGAIKSIDVFSYQPEIYSASSGTVVSVFHIGEVAILMIKKGDDYFVYSGLKSIAVKKGDVLKEGALIGELSAREDDKLYSAEFEIARLVNGKTRFSSTHDMLELVGKRCETHD